MVFVVFAFGRLLHCVVGIADPFGGSDPFSGPNEGIQSKSGDPFAANFADFGSGVSVLDAG